MKHPAACIQCGTCVTVCPVEMVGGHAIVSFLADPDTTDYSVWLCTSCWRCQEACPGGVDIYELMMEQRRREQTSPKLRRNFAEPSARGLARRLSRGAQTSASPRPEARPEGSVEVLSRAVEPAPAGYQAAFEHVLACGLALEVPQEELDQVRAAWGLEPVRLPSPDLVRSLLRGNKCSH